jgi:uncharacterized phage protein (TIGR02218 family)
MKPASTALINFLAAKRASGDSTLLFADCYSFALKSGTTLNYTSIDVPVTIAGVTFVANSVQVQGLNYKATIGLEDEGQQVTLLAGPDDLVDGAPFLQALRNGAFDGCTVTRQRVFFPDYLGGTQVGTVTLFAGLISTVDKIGTVSAEVTIASDLKLLDLDMPRNLYQRSCLHTLYDSGCTLAKASFSTAGTVGAGSTALVINWSGANANFVQGSIAFSSGANANIAATVTAAVAGTSLRLSRPLDEVPAAGDAFSVAYGCDHQLSTCLAKFNNVDNFRGFPSVPPPETAA